MAPSALPFAKGLHCPLPFAKGSTTPYLWLSGSTTPYLCPSQVGSAFGQPALRRLLSAPEHAPGCPCPNTLTSLGRSAAWVALAPKPSRACFRRRQRGLGRRELQRLHPHLRDQRGLGPLVRRPRGATIHARGERGEEGVDLWRHLIQTRVSQRLAQSYAFVRKTGS